MEFVYGHLLEVGPTGQVNQYLFQNYAIGRNIAVWQHGDRSQLCRGGFGQHLCRQGLNGALELKQLCR